MNILKNLIDNMTKKKNQEVNIINHNVYMVQIQRCLVQFVQPCVKKGIKILKKRKINVEFV